MGERRGIRPLLATNIDMYRAGHMPVSSPTEPTTSTQQLLQPHSQPLGARITSPSAMSRLKELGMQPKDRPKVHSRETLHKRKWAPAGSEGLDHPQLWLRRKQVP
jgi:hypothetical protein